jgi:hypothetical protein
MKALCKALFALAAAAGGAALPSTGGAQTLTYHVDLNVAALLASPLTAPYSLDLQLNGDGLPAAGTNMITASNFVFTLGSATGTPSTFEGASGSLTSSVALSESASTPLNEFYQSFSATTTDIQFDVTSTENGSGITPDEFSVSILDNNLNQIATTATDGVSLVTETINGSVPAPTTQAYQSTSPAGVTAGVVPEPATVSILLVGVCGLILLRASNRARVSGKFS